MLKPIAKSALIAMACSLAIATANAADTAKIDVPAGNLAEALTILSKQANVDLVYQSRHIERFQTRGVRGQLTVREAVQRLLEGTPLLMSTDESSGAMMIVDPDKTGATSTAKVLRVAESHTGVDGSSTSMQAGQLLDEIVVVGERELGYNSRTQSAALFGEQSLLDTPFQVSVFPIELLQDQQVRTLFHVTKNDASTGVSSTGTTGYYDAVAIRGFRLDNNSGYYRDGAVFANNAQTPFENKAAVEIVKGLSALRYGFTSPGGVVNYVLKRPTEQPYRFVDVFGDSNGGHGVHVDLGGKVTDDIGVRFNSVVAHESTFLNGADGERKLISMFMSWDPTDRLSIEADVEYQHRESQLGGDFRLQRFDASMSHEQIRTLLDRFDRKTYIGESWTEYPTRSFIGAVRATYEFAPGWKFKAAVQQADLQRSQTNISPTFIEANGDYLVDVRYQPNQEFKPFSFEAAIAGDFSTGSVEHSAVVGMIVLDHPFYAPNAVSTTQGSNNLFNPSHVARPVLTASQASIKQRSDQFALYATDYMHITERFNVFAGVRYTKPEFESFYGANGARDSFYEESALTPSAGVIFKPQPNVSFYASYAEGLERGGMAPLGTVNANQLLPPLASRQYEAGVKANLFNDATLSAALFEIDKPLELVNDQNRYVQDGRQVHRGIEVSLSGQVSDRLRLVTSALYLDAELEKTGNGALDGLQPIDVSELQLSGFASWRLPVERDIEVNFGVFYSDEKFVDNLNTFAVDDFIRFDAGVRHGFKIGNTDATLRLVVENLSNENYFSGTFFGFLVYGEPRTFRLSLSASY